jgi:hypothetical protein
MDVGRWYKDNSGQEFRYIGSPDDDKSIGLFSIGDKIIEKPLSDFDNMPKEKKLFGFFKKGGITANDLLEARSFFGEGEWKKLTREDRIKSARYLKRTGKIGYKKGGKINQGDLPDFISMQYDKGGKMGRYTVNVYYGGEMENEEIYTDSLAEAKKISQQGEHSEIYDNVKKVFIEEYAKGGIVTKSKVIAELQKLGFGKEKAENLLEKHIDIYEINEDDEDAKTIALQIEEQYNQEYGKGGTIDEMVKSLRKKKEDLKEQYKNAQMDGINTDKLLVKIQKVNNELNSALKQMFSSIKLSDGGELDEEDSLDYNSISDLQSERNRLVRWKYQYNSKGADYKIKQLEERIDYLKSKDKMSKGGKLRTPQEGELVKGFGHKYSTPIFEVNEKNKTFKIDSPNYWDFDDVLISFDKVLYSEDDNEWVKKMAKGGKLVGKQKNIDVNKNGKLDAEDFKLLRRRKMAKGGITDKEMLKVSELVKYYHQVRFESDAAASNDENAKSIRLLDRADNYRKEAMSLIDAYNKKNNTNFSFQDFNRDGTLREGISSGLKVPEEYTNPKAEEARYKYVVETKYPYDKQVFITNFSQEEKERDPSYKAALDVLKKAQKNKEFQEGHIMFSFYIKGFGTSYSTVLHTKNKMAKGGKVTFQDKADAIADSLEGKKVAPKYRKQYGAKYDRSEAEMAGKRIAGAMRKKYGM